MGKLWKGLSSIAIVLILFIFLFVMNENQMVVPWFGHVTLFEDTAFGSTYLPYFLFWGSGLCLLLLGTFLIGIWLIPSNKDSLLLKEKNGELKIERKALENFVRQTLQREVLIEDASIKVKINKKAVTVKISGKMRQVPALPEHTRYLIETIKKGFEQLFGIKEQITVKVVLKDYRQSQKAATKNRVE